MPRKPPSFKSDREVPNPRKLEEAQDFHAATRTLSRSLDSTLLSYYVMGGLALETYLKALNLFWEYSNIPAEMNGEKLTSAPDGLPLDCYVQTPASDREHDLVTLFDELDDNIREDLAGRYAAAPALSGPQSFGEALTRYRKTFVHARYPSEDGGGLPEGPVDDLLRLLDFLGGYVNELHANNPNTKLRAQLSTASVSEGRPGARAVVHAGRIDSNAVFLDSGEALPEETIVHVWPRDGAESVEVGVVRQGSIELEWPDSIPDGTPVNLKVIGKLLPLDQIDPFFRIGELPPVAADVDSQPTLPQWTAADPPRVGP